MQINLVVRFSGSARAVAPQFRGDEVDNETGKICALKFHLLSFFQDIHPIF